jgi:glycosyltransferase involved in cell wall biosynthesis
LDRYRKLNSLENNLSVFGAEMTQIKNYAEIVADKQENDQPVHPSEIGSFIQPMVSRPTVSVIIPTLNEAKNLPLVLPYLPMNWVDEVVLVDGRSTDDTVEVAKRLLPTIKIVLEEKKGKGAAMRAGYLASCGDILIVLDADGSNDPREIPRFVTALLEGADFVKGSRFAPGGGTTDMPRYRMLGNGAFVLMGNLLFGVKFTDLCYGYHAFWRYCLDAIQLESFQGFEIDTALYLQAANARLRIVEVPSFEGYRFFGIGKLQTIPDGFRVLNTIFHLWSKKIGKSNEALPLGFRGIKYARPQVFEKHPMEQLDENFAHRLMEFIRLLSIMMLTGNDTSQVIQRVLKLTLEAAGADSGSLILLDENGNVKDGCFASEDGFQTPDISAWTDVINQGVAGWAIKNHQPVLILDTQKDPRWLQREWDERHRSALALPLSIGGMVVGALTLMRPEAKKFTEEELEKFSPTNI